MLKKVEQKVDLPDLNLGELSLTLVGDTPLLVHQWSQKNKKAMLDKQMKKATAGKAPKDPEQDFQDSLYHLEDGKYGFPVIGFKASAVTACTSIGGMTKVQARQAFRILGEYAVIEGAEPTMREDMVKIAMGTADLRYRGEFSPWFTTLNILFNQNVVSGEQIANMFNTAGFGVGIGEWRSERDGQFGMFHVATSADKKLIDKFRHKK